VLVGKGTAGGGCGKVGSGILAVRAGAGRGAPGGCARGAAAAAAHPELGRALPGLQQWALVGPEQQPLAGTSLTAKARCLSCCSHQQDRFFIAVSSSSETKLAPPCL